VLLATLAEQRAAAQSPHDIALLERRIDELVFRLFALNAEERQTVEESLAAIVPITKVSPPLAQAA
jgi:hypothetical protein